MTKLGLALGGGGAKGLAHIPLFEVFDDLGIRPYRIAGTGIGAVLGAAKHVPPASEKHSEWGDPFFPVRDL